MKEQFKRINSPRNELKRKMRNNKAITLIALIVTIIVLLILAGVSIATLTGDNGLLTKVQQAKEENKKASDRDLIAMAVSEAQIGENGYQELNFHSFQKSLNNQFGESSAILSIEENRTYTVSCLRSLKDYTVSENEIKEIVDWNEKMANAEAPKSQDEERNNGVLGIGTDGNPVDMDLWEYTFDSETGGYALNSEEAINGGKTIAGYRGNVKDDGTIEGNVPQYIKVNNGEWTPVTSLYRTFQGNDATNQELKKLTTAPKIPPTIKSMKMTFEYCERLCKISCIPGAVKELLWTFDGYTALKEMPQIGYGVENMLGTFAGCSELTELSALPNTVKNLDSTFYECKALQEVPNIPDSVTNIKSTFHNCTGLKNININIPENVTNIQQTFAGCLNIEGTIIINCNPEVYVNFLQDTSKSIILTGKSTMLNQIREARSNVTVLY